MTGNITIFTTCKPFYGEAAILQKNALQTWKKLNLPIIICGNEPGTKDAATTLNATHLTDIARSSTEIPYVSSVFYEAEKASKTSFLMYINSDILLMPSFLKAVENVTKTYSDRDTPLLMTCRRRNIPLGHVIGFEWENTLKSLDSLFGSWDQSNAIDMFLFRRGLFNEIPPFVIGHMQWDNWLLWKARQQGADIVDASLDTALLHPIHGYCGDGTGLQQRAQNKDAVRNRRLAEGNSLDLDTATTHLLIDGTVMERDTDNYSAVKEKCQLNLAKEFWAGVKYLSETKYQYTTDEIIDCCRTILWRQQLFFTYLEKTKTTKGKINAAVSNMIECLETNNLEEAKAILQDFISDSLLQRVQLAVNNNRPIYIWGCGQAGYRLLDFLERHNISVEAFIDSDDNKIGTAVRGYKIMGLNTVQNQKKTSPFFLIASMFLGEIANKLNNSGIVLHTDYSG